MGQKPSKMKSGKRQAPTVHIRKFFNQGRKQVDSKGIAKSKTGSRLYVKGVVAGYRRTLTNQKNHTSLIKIQGVEDSNDAKFYEGKKIMSMYRTKTAQGENGSRFRVMWGKVCGSHGPTGIVRCTFRKTL